MSSGSKFRLDMLLMYHVRSHFGEFWQEKGQDFRFYVKKEHSPPRLNEKVERLRQALSKLCKDLDIYVTENPLDEAVIKIFCDGQYAEIVVPLVKVGSFKRRV